MDRSALMGRYIVGAYATSPNLFSWNKDSEAVFFDRLKVLNSIRGLELPFWGKSLHQFDDQWLLSNLHPDWQNVLTCVPGTMKNLESDPYFGLASKKQSSRKNAINFYLDAYKSVNQLKNTFGDNSVIAIIITSSPFINNEQLYADKEYFILSLREILSWEWGKTKLLIEHCDAFGKQNQKPQKGFLSIEDEIESILNLDLKFSSNIGIVINWGRSAIEYKDIKGPLIHIEQAIHNNILSGLMFSGTTDNNDNLYGAWSDLHMPPSNYLDFKFFESESLMSYDNIKKTLVKSDFEKLDFIGIKLLAQPSSSSIEKRVGINRDAMTLIDLAINEIKI